MKMCDLDWTHAWPEKSCRSALGEKACHAGADAEKCPHADTSRFVERLRKEVPSLPFLSLPFAEELAKQIDGFTDFFQSYKHMLVLGIGGSALGPRALQKAFFPQQDRPCHDGPWLWIADNVDPVGFQANLDALPVEDTLVVVISKSGGTIETISQYLLVLPWLQKSLPGTWQEHLFMITDEKKGFLRDETDKHFLRSLPVPDHLGGRYSVLSAVGLVPAAFMGMDWKALLAGAAEFGRPLADNPDLLPTHPAWKLAVWASHMSFSGFSQLLFFTYVPSWATFGPWFAQLWAESLGKQGKGTMPIPAVGVTDQHSLLQMFLDGPADKACLFLNSPAAAGPVLQGDLPHPWEWLKGIGIGDILNAEALATRMSLSQKGIPLVELSVPDTNEYTAGKMLMLLEAATVFTGWLLDIDPLDQPAVEEGKILAKARLGAPGSDDSRLQAFLNAPATREQF